MGQRTQIAIIQEGAKQRNRKIDVFHQQWGYGMGLIRRLENIVNRTYTTTYEEWENGIDFFKMDLGVDLVKEYNQSPKNLKSFLRSQDNDNGYMVVKITMDRENAFQSDIKVGFYSTNMEYRSAIKNVSEEMDLEAEALKKVKRFINAFKDLHEIEERDVLGE